MPSSTATNSGNNAGQSCPIAEKMIKYKIDDKEMDSASFLAFVHRVWPGEYDEEKTGAEGFYEKNGCKKGLRSYVLERKN